MTSSSSPQSSAPAIKPRLLIVDDDPLIVDTLTFVLAADFDVFAASSRESCIQQLRSLPEPPPLALVDLGLPPRPHRPDEGFALIADLLAHSPAMKIIVLSGQNDEANARHSRTLGATDFIAKPAAPSALRDLLLSALAFNYSEEAQESSPQAATPHEHFIGESLPLQKLRTQTRQFADSPFPVLIEGESGSGKELVAASLHEASARRNNPYLALNCAAIAPTLVEPTLFGYARGAFTGANNAKSGYFEDAADGTLFLDEIGELPLELQSKLLRVLENGEFQRVGETQTRKSRARVVAATNRDLRREVKEGRFRTDLYHRLTVFSLTVPPLRERGDDRLILLEHFRRLYASASGSKAFELSEAARQRWLGYRFPGNVRELRNIVIRLTAKHAGCVISVADLVAEFDTQDQDTAPPSPTDLLERVMQEINDTPGFRLDHALRQWERAYIDAAQQIANGNVSQAARLLGLNRTTLYNRMEALARNQTSSGQ